jgi:hypothetical protein
MLYSDEEEEENSWTLPEDCEILHVIVMGQPSDLFLSFYIVSPELHTKFEWKLFEGIQSLCTFGKPFKIFMDCWCNGMHPLNKYKVSLDHLFPKGHYLIKYIYKEIPFQDVAPPPTLSTFAAIAVRTNLLTDMAPPGIINLLGAHRHIVISTPNTTPTCNLLTCVYQKTIQNLRHKLSMNGL